MNGGVGGPTSVASEPTPPPTYLTELNLEFNNTLPNVQSDLGFDLTRLDIWNAKFPNANFLSVNINQTDPNAPIIVLSGNTVNAGGIAGQAFYNKTTINIIHDIMANCIIEVPDTESFAFSSIHGVNLAAVTTLGPASFANCTSLQSVIMPSLVDIAPGGASSGAFSGCSTLDVIQFDSLELIPSGTFYGDTSLAHIDALRAVTTIGPYAFSHSGVTEIAELRALNSIGPYAFNLCRGLNAVSLSNPTFIGVHAFEGCDTLTGINAYGDITFEGNDVFLNVANGGVANFTINQENLDNYNNISYLINTKGWTVNYIN